MCEGILPNAILLSAVPVSVIWLIVVTPFGDKNINFDTLKLNAILFFLIRKPKTIGKTP
jgi:hypothetical protein